MNESQRRQAKTKPPRTGMSKEVKLLLGIGLVLVIGAAVLLLARPGAPDDAAPAETSAIADTTLVPEDSYSLGSPNAPVTVVEFLDPECESCRAVYPTVKRVLAEYGEDVFFVVRYFPLHRNSVLAAKAAEAAGLQGKYWEMLDVLFELQPDWGERTQPQTDLMLHYARELGLDMVKFEQDLNRPDIEQKIQRDKAAGIAAGVEGTPTFFINGKLAGNVMSYSQFSSRIEAQLP